MKKVSLVLGMVLAVSMAMAQKTTWVTQSGNGNEANVTQQASLVDGNDATSIYATQTGAWNVLNTDQSGNNNYIELNQNGNNNTANMIQKTLENIAFGGINNALVYQAGSANAANLTQKEADQSRITVDLSKNTSVATQAGTNGTFNLNQGGATFKPENVQTLYQTGNGNMANIDQKGIKDMSTIAQTGAWNGANLKQLEVGMSAAFDKSYSSQAGHNNTLNVTQDTDAPIILVGGTGIQYAESYQASSQSTTNINQNSAGVQQVVGSQAGTNDHLNVTQKY